MLKGLKFFTEIIKAPCHNRLIYAGEGGITVQGIQLLNYQQASEV